MKKKSMKKGKAKDFGYTLGGMDYKSKKDKKK